MLYKISWFVIVLAIVQVTINATVDPPHNDETPALDFSLGGRVGLHGMVVFGDSDTGLYMSHIPMFNLPHDVQVVFAVDFPAKRKSFADRNYTFKPRPFSLDDAILGNLKLIKGVLFAGNFEAGGEPIDDTLSVTIRGIAIAAKKLANLPAPPESLTYNVIGDGRYLVHPISTSNDFDQILALDKPILATSHQGDTPQVVIPGTPNDVNSRLLAGNLVFGSKVSAELSTLVGPDFTDSP